MQKPVRSDKDFRRTLDQFLWAATLAFAGSVMVLGNHWLTVNRSALEARFFPVVTDHTFRNWEWDAASGYPSAEVYVYKARAECVYVGNQIETAIGITPDGDILEVLVMYVDDPSPGSNRSVGWQRLDARVVYSSEKLVEGSLLRGQTLHNCLDKTLPNVTSWGPVKVGEDMALPPYVMAWVAAGREGRPSDYR